MKKAVLLLLFFMLTLEFRIAAGDSWNGYEYIIRDDGAVIIEYSGSEADITIPLSFENRPVVGIADNAFEGNPRLEKISMPSTIEFIGKRAFAGCSSLNYVNISSGLRSIGEEAFADCVSLFNFTLPAKLERIGKKAFAGSVNISYIHDVTGGFLHEVGSHAFDDTLWFRNFNGDYVTICQGSFLLKYRGSEGNPALPWDIVYIAEDAFAGHDEITRLQLPNYVTLLQTGAISDMASLRSVTGGAGLTAVADHAFRNLPLLDSVELDRVELSMDNFYDCPLSPFGSEDSMPYDLSIPDEADSAFETAFDEELNGVKIIHCLKDAVGKDGLLVFPDRIRGKRVVSVGVGACQDRDDIQTIIFPNYLTVIESWAFAYDTELGEVVFPERLQRIEADAFTNCGVLAVPELDGIDVDPRAFYRSE